MITHCLCFLTFLSTWNLLGDQLVFARAASILGCILAVPLVVTGWFRLRAGKAPEEARPAIVFTYRRFLMGTAWGGSLAWWIALDALHADWLIRVLIPWLWLPDETLSIFLTWFLLWLPAVVVFFVCLALSPIHSLRGAVRTPAEAVNQSFWVVARFVVPTAFLVAGIMELFESPRFGVALLAGWIFTGRLTARKVADSHGAHLQALTCGEIRDRAFAIAKKAGAKLNQVYVLPSEKRRLANAYAHAANNIFLTDYLLKNLNRREVDAIIGHEVTHLQRNHARMRILTWLGAGLVIGFAAGIPQQLIPLGIPAGPALYAIFLCVLFALSRRNEYAADTGAWRLTGDAQALITGLARVSRLNTMPIEWGKLDEKMLTHPSTMRRMKNLAHLEGLSEALIPDLLRSSAEPPTDTYPVPPAAQLSGKIFSTRFKAASSSSYAWISILSTALVPTGFALAVQQFRLSGFLLLGALLLGVVCTVSVSLAVSIVFPLRGMPRIEKRLREKLQTDGAPPSIRQGLFVALSPDPGPRVYENNYAWDVGLLAVSKDKLCYWGEEARFCLDRKEVTSVSLGQGTVNWLKSPSIYVSWQDAAGAARVFNLRALSSSSMLQMASQTRRLAGALQNWYRDVPATASLILRTNEGLPAESGSLGVPAFGEVTSQSPKTLVRGNLLSRLFLFDTFVATAVAVLAGLHVPILDTIGPGAGPFDFGSSGAAFLYILGTVWIARAWQLWPYWRLRESTQPNAPASLPAAIQADSGN
jgi:Zn-dependent protease with chaperone function